MEFEKKATKKDFTNKKNNVKKYFFHRSGQGVVTTCFKNDV